VPEKRGVPRDPGKVAFRQYFIDKDSLTLQVRCSRVEVTQDCFIEYLITGIFPRMARTGNSETGPRMGTSNRQLSSGFLKV
jgi:hypothetical protein